MSLIELLKSRLLIDSLTDEAIDRILSSECKLIYLGIDPTAPGIHLGNFVGLKILKHFQEFGHKPVILLGGATALIGDPSGKSKERPLLSVEQVQTNIIAIKRQVQAVLATNNENVAPLFVNNYDWMRSMDMITFLRDVGKYFRVSSMLAKESVKSRLNSDEGISFTEMSYQIMQAYDFYHLNKEYSVFLQIGGSDQYGNITAGIEYTRKVASKKLFGLTNPLLTRSDGGKFGKSEKGTIWLDDALCSCYDFYQHLLKVSDKDVSKFLKMLTFVDLDELASIEQQVKEGKKAPNELQKLLAKEMTLLIHGQEGLKRAIETSKVVAPGSVTFDENKLEQIKDDVGSVLLAFNEVIGKSFLDVMVETKLVSSKSEIRRLIKNRGVYLNGQNVLDPQYILSKQDVLKKGFVFISVGKKRVKLIEIEDF